MDLRKYLDPDTCWTCRDSWQHFGAGAAIDLAIRLVLRASLNHLVPRILIVGVIGAAYEALQAYETRNLPRAPGYGFSVKDLVMDCAGALAVELVLLVGKGLF